MTKAKAVELLNELFDSYLTMEGACLDTIIKVDGKQFTLRDKLDEITDEKIAILTAIDALEQNTTVEAEHDKGWISVTDELPKLGERVMAFCRAGILTFLRYDGEVWFEMSSRNEYLHSFVTHWQPLPTPPKEVDTK